MRANQNAQRDRLKEDAKGYDGRLIVEGVVCSFKKSERDIVGVCTGFEVTTKDGTKSITLKIDEIEGAYKPSNDGLKMVALHP